MSEKEKRDKPLRKSRFVAKPEEMKFMTREESDAFVAKRKAEIQAYLDEMKAEKEKTKSQAEDDVPKSD